MKVIGQLNVHVKYGTQSAPLVLDRAYLDETGLSTFNLTGNGLQQYEPYPMDSMCF